MNYARSEGVIKGGLGIFLIPVDTSSMPKKRKRHSNRLITEKSPYLLQHAHDPVDWYSWSEEVFEKAKNEDKPIFLSIGYSTCHWCHVMKEESFNDPQIAELLNTHFIPIIVDREERPDLDNLYMKAVISMTGSGGWPLNIFLTHDKKPFYGGTYFPPEDKWEMSGLKTILASFSNLWKSQRQEVLNTAAVVIDGIIRQRLDKSGPLLDQKVFGKAYERLFSSFDRQFAGFGRGAKFPRPHILSFLLRYWSRFSEPFALEMVEKTLMHMAQGGLYDHIGGGFFRYAVDPEWRIPHFEKMLYDQALISKTYLEAYQATHKDVFAQIAKGTLDYVLRKMSSPEGGFYTGEDADSALDPREPEKKKEGAFYLFSQDEIIGTLGKKQAEIFIYYFGLEQTESTAFYADPEVRGKGILSIANSLKNTAMHFNKSEKEVSQILKEGKEKLFAFRSKRPRPSRDEKILVDWNGLMISSLALASRIFDEPWYRMKAEKCAHFILNNLVDHQGKLLHRYCHGEAGIFGMIDDYAFIIQGLLDLYEATFDIVYLKRAKDFTELMIQLFWDEIEGGFFFTPRDEHPLFIRQKEIYDGSIPSGNSVAALNLIRLTKLLVSRENEEKVKSLSHVFSRKILHLPDEFCQFLIALDFALGRPSHEMVFTGNKENETLKRMVLSCYQQFIPNKVMAHRPTAGSELDEVLDIMPHLVNQTPIDGRPTAYMCKNYVCEYPTTSVKKFRQMLSEL